MSGLVVRHEGREGLLLQEGRKGFVRDSLELWARRLRKSSRTVRRYAQAGIIPNAYQTAGGQWRAPFTNAALRAVEQKLAGVVRTSRNPSWSRLLREWPTEHESEAKVYVAAYALLLAVKREPLMSEKELLELYQTVLFTLNDPHQAKVAHRAFLRSEAWLPAWQKCLAFARKSGFRKTALVAAFAHAGADLLAGETKSEVYQSFQKGRFLPFGRPVKGEIGVANKRKQPKGLMSSVDSSIEQGTRLRKQVIVMAKNWFSLRSVIQKWQWIVGRRDIKNRAVTIEQGSVHLPVRYFSRRTFYAWYPARVRREARRVAVKLLINEGRSVGALA